MKKVLTLALVLCLAATLIVGCGAQNESQQEPDASNEPIKISVGASPVPHAEILEVVKPLLEKEGNYLGYSGVYRLCAAKYST